MTNHLLLFIAACVPLETGIDNSRIDGTVTWGPTSVIEQANVANDQRATPEVLPDLSPSATLLSGALDDSGVDAAGEPLGDADIYQVISPVDLRGYDLIVRSPQGRVRVQVFDLDAPPGNYFASIDVDGSGRVPFAALTPSGTTSTTPSGYTTFNTTGADRFDGIAAGVRYGVRVFGIDTPADAPYELILRGYSPAREQVLVGAWQETTLEERTFPVAGTTVASWSGGGAADDWVWTGTYSMFLVRSLASEEGAEGEPEVVGYDEDIQEVWLWAGTWANLNQGLPGGTVYSNEPQRVVLDGEPVSLLATDAVVYTPDGPLVLDAVAPIVIGQEFTDTEPNDAVYTSVAFPPSLDGAAMATAAQDVGVLSGPGFADLFAGSITWNDLSTYGYGAHDSDVYRFEVPAPSKLLLFADWDTSQADLDVFVFDADGGFVDGAASYDKPEVGGGTFTFEPGETYFLHIVGYISYDGADANYDMRVEAF